MLAFPAAFVILFFLPLRHDSGQYVVKVKKIDYGGIVLNLASVLLILVSFLRIRIVHDLIRTRSLSPAQAPRMHGTPHS
jgi:flagellar biosynthesis protein FliP